MKNKKNIIWAFFSSVRLALFTLFVLAGASIFGTVIKQGESFGYYLGYWGEGKAKIITTLKLDNMYESWWFNGLLILFSINLIVCTLERFPNIWRLVTINNLETDTSRIEKMPQRHTLLAGRPLQEIAAAMPAILTEAGWKAVAADKEQGVLFASQKGSWSRLGVIMVHISILVIFAGAIIGAAWGWKGSLYIPEGSVADRVYSFSKNHDAIPLGFQVACDRFNISYYANGAPKEYRSDLAVFDLQGKHLFDKTIVVNSPLQHEGITFYQSSYQPVGNEFLVFMQNKSTGQNQRFIISPRMPVKWPEENIEFSLKSKIPPRMRSESPLYMMQITRAAEEPQNFRAKDDQTTPLNLGGDSYDFYIKERYETGLQVAKDPGVWYVYIGCTLMIIGLIVAFFLSHRRIWLYLAPEGDKTRILIAGISNKNKIGFERDFEKLTDRLDNTEQLNLVKE